MAEFCPPYSMGIDIGTTSIKIAIVDSNGSILENVNVASLAQVESDVGDVGSEQCPHTIWSVLHAAIRQLSPHNQVKGKAWVREDEQTRTITLDNVSHLYTWQDRRCSQQFLATLPAPQSGLRVASGYGCATLFWFLRNRPQFLQEKNFTSLGTIMDFIVAAICDLERPVTSDQLAASMGYFDVATGLWNHDILQASGFPVSMLPEVRPAGQVAGHLLQGLDHIPAGTPVLVAMGDMQCGVLSTVHGQSDALLNISTSVQLSTVVMDAAKGTSLSERCPAVEVVPYFDNCRLAVVAGLNGGNIQTAFVAMIKHWLRELGIAHDDIVDKVMLDRLVALGCASPPSSLQILPTIYGERHDATLLGRASGISCDNASLGGLFRATSQGIVDNIFQLMPLDVLAAHGVTKVIGSGSVLSQNAVVLERLEKVLADRMDFERGTQSDSALGAAKAALIQVKVMSAN